METYFNSFQQDEQMHENLLFSTVDEVMKDQLNILESIKADENIILKEQNVKNIDLSEKEDFHQLMSDWQQPVELLHSIDSGDLELGLDHRSHNGDIFSKNSFESLFEEIENTGYSKTLKYSLQKSSISNNSSSVLFGSNELNKEPVVNKKSNFQNCHKLYELMNRENKILGKITVLNGEKEILGKNIIELHCLNKIEEDPQDNCQVTSAVINGKRYKIIIKPKSLKMKKLNNNKVKKSLIKKLKCNSVMKLPEPKEDEIISEMRNGNYNVPLLESDILLNWNLINLDSEWNKQMSYEYESSTAEKQESENASNVSTLCIQIPKNHNEKQEEDVKKIAGSEKIEKMTLPNPNSLNELVKNTENKCLKSHSKQNYDFTEAKSSDIEEKSNLHCEIIKNNNSKHNLRQNDVEQLNTYCKEPLFQVVPLKKTGKCSIRMLDALAMMNKNKLLKIMSNNDTISLDHDYCRTLNFKMASGKETKKLNISIEKNLKKDNDMESDDISNINAGVNSPVNFQNLQSSKGSNSLLHSYLNKKEEDQLVEQEIQINELKEKNLFFRNSKANENKAWMSDSSDSVKTEIVSNGNKALTNCVLVSNLSSENNNDDLSLINVYSENNNKNQCESEKPKKDNVTSLESTRDGTELPKKKLKLEEYLSRRNAREKEKKVLNVEHSATSNDPLPQEYDTKASDAKAQLEKTNHDLNVFEDMISDANEQKNKTSYCDNSRSSLNFLADKNNSIGDRKQSESKYRTKVRSSSGERNCSTPEKRYDSREQSFWSGSSSRSSSSGSCSSSDYSTSKKCKNSFRSRSSSREVSKSQNRAYSDLYHNKNYHSDKMSTERRSRSRYRAQSFREKQRQIEERRVIYVGRIEKGMTNEKLRQRFSIFGPVIDISLHFREFGDNYGFVTYAYKSDAYDAVEHGNDDPSLPHYDLCFGGRRGFCKGKYADLDGMPTSYSYLNDSPTFLNSKDSFDLLLKEAQAKLKNRKKQL